MCASEAPSVLGRGELACRPLDQPYPDAFLQGCERARDRRRRAAKPARGPGKAAGVEDRRENCQFVEAIHRLFQYLQE